MSYFKFSNIACEQVERLEHSFGRSYVKYQAFEEKYKYDPGFKSVVDNTNNQTNSFQDNWIAFQPSCPNLVKCCGGLASPFSGTSPVESDFSIIGWEKDEYRLNLTDLSLEGVLHSKQKAILDQTEKYLDQINH